MLVHRCAYKWIGATVLVVASVTLMGFAQNLNSEDLKARIEQRYRVLPLRNGIVLTPRDRSATLSIEISGNTVAIDGVEVSGGELRTRLGADAEVILQLSYLAPTERQSLFGFRANQNDSSQIGTPGTGQRSVPLQRIRRRGDVVRFGGDVVVERDETVDGDVAVIGGSAQVDGQVEGDVVVIGGKLDIGPEANITEDVTVVGGTLSRHPNSIIGGDVNEVGIGGSNGRVGQILANRGVFRRGIPFLGVAGTALRVGALLVFGCIVMLLAGGAVRRIGERAAAEPVKAGLAGLLAEALLLPALIMTIVFLIITIVGIPLLVLVPFGVLAVIVIFLLGFTSVAARVGQLIAARLGWAGPRPYLMTVLGIATLLLPILLARVVGLAGLSWIALPLLALGLVVEYLAWTVGFGAAVLSYLAPSRVPVPPAGEQMSAAPNS